MTQLNWNTAGTESEDHGGGMTMTPAEKWQAGKDAGLSPEAMRQNCRALIVRYEQLAQKADERAKPTASIWSNGDDYRAAARRAESLLAWAEGKE